MARLHVGRLDAGGRGADQRVRSAHAASISASTRCLRSSRSGTLSWMKSASVTASAMVLTKVILPFLGRAPWSAWPVGARGLHHLADLAVRPRDRDRRSRRRCRSASKPRDPARADDAAADAAGARIGDDSSRRRCAHRTYHRPPSASSASASCALPRGPMTRAPMPSTTLDGPLDQLRVGGELRPCRARDCPPARRGHCRRPAPPPPA